MLALLAMLEFDNFYTCAMLDLKNEANFRSNYTFLGKCTAINLNIATPLSRATVSYKIGYFCNGVNLAGPTAAISLS